MDLKNSATALAINNAIDLPGTKLASLARLHSKDKIVGNFRRKAFDREVPAK